MRRKMIGLCEATKLYGGAGITTFPRPRYVPDGYCEWCGKPLPKRRSSCCSKECTWYFNRATNSAYGAGGGGGYRNHIMRRDNYTCQRCGTFHAWINKNGIPCPTNDGELDVHHIIPVSEGGDDNPDNLITLCRDCHKEVHKSNENDTIQG